MNALFVHGMGRSSLSWLPTIARFKAQGIRCHTFGYQVTRQDFAGISRSLLASLNLMAGRGEYVVVGHSLGGMLLRAALANLPEGADRPMALFLLGSPIQVSRLALHFHSNLLFRMMTRDSGRLLGSSSRMQALPQPSTLTVAIIGTRGLRGRLSPFGDEINDGLVAASEASADWIDEVSYVPVIHTFLPFSRQVAELMLERIHVLN